MVFAVDGDMILARYSSYRKILQEIFGDQMPGYPAVDEKLEPHATKMHGPATRAIFPTPGYVWDAVSGLLWMKSRSVCEAHCLHCSAISR